MPRSSPLPRMVMRALAATLLFAPIACGSPVEVLWTMRDLGESEVTLFDGLVQRITVSPADPEIGGEIEIRSVLRNTGQTTPRFLANVCRLDLESALELMTAPEWAECKGLPRQVDLEPGDSSVVVTRQRVHGDVGEHEVLVLHVLEPAHRVPVKVRLQPLS